MKSSIPVSLAVLAALSATNAFATNGYFNHGYGMSHKGMAGAGVAVSEELMSAALNPAALNVSGAEISVGLEFFSPDRRYSVSAVNEYYPGAFYLQPQQTESENSIFAIPEFAWGYSINEQLDFGVLVYANGGMNTEYASSSQNPGTFYAGTTGVDLKQLFISPTLSYSLSNSTRVGVSPIFVVQQFEAQGLASFAPFSQSATKLSNNGTDTATGLGVQLGVQHAVNDALSLGMSYRSAVDMEKFDKYAGLFAEQGGFDLPSAWQIGAAWQVNDAHQLLIDVQGIQYGDVKSIANPIENIMTAPLGNDAAAGFGWQDITVYKLGWQWQANTEQKWRVGVSYGEQPIDQSQVLFNILAPGVQEWHYTAGLTQKLTDGVTITAMGFYSPNKSVSGANYLAPNQTLSIEMDQFGFGASISWKL